MRRQTSLRGDAVTAINREIGSKYDVIKDVQEHLGLIEDIGNTDLDALVDALNEAKDFSGITVVSGTPASWNATTKTLTVPTLKGDKGDQGEAGEAGVDGVNGGTPIFDFSYNVATGNLEYEIVDYGYDVVPDEE